MFSYRKCTFLGFMNSYIPNAVKPEASQYHFSFDKCNCLESWIHIYHMYMFISYTNFRKRKVKRDLKMHEENVITLSTYIHLIFARFLTGTIDKTIHSCHAINIRLNNIKVPLFNSYVTFRYSFLSISNNEKRIQSVPSLGLRTDLSCVWVF